MDQPATPSSKLRFIPRTSDSAENSVELADLLNQVRGICEELGAGFSEPLARVAELQERLAEERFQLAVLGQFKRGKSTLLNALLGESILPTGVVPLTSIPTYLRSGEKRAVRVFFHDGRHAEFCDLTLEEASDVLARHVTEKENPRNQLGVERVEVEHPSSLLIAGVVLIDTPGIGSTLRHNTEVTLDFLSQCDAALFVVSADPPITEVEKDFLKAVQGKVAKLCFVMNKVDYLTESDLAEITVFFRTILKELGIQETETIFNVSAKRGIEATVKKDPLQWRESGLEQLQSYLLDFLSREKSRALQIALAGKAVEIAGDAALNVRLQQRSLQLSRHELARRIEVFDSKVKEIDQEKIKMGDLLAGDKKRIALLLEDLAETLRRDARQHLRHITSKAFPNNSDPASMERQARDWIADEIPAYFAEKLVSFSGEMNRDLQQVLRPYHESLDTLIATLRSTAAELFEIPYRPTASNGRLEEVHKPYWVTQKWNTLISPLPAGFLDHFLPLGLRKHRAEKRISEEIETLVAHNVENIRWATLRNLDGTFRRFSTTLDDRLKETANATRAAMRIAQLRQTADEQTAEPEIVRLGEKAGQLEKLKNTLAHFIGSFS